VELRFQKTCNLSGRGVTQSTARQRSAGVVRGGCGASTAPASGKWSQPTPQFAAGAQRCGSVLYHSSTV